MKFSCANISTLTVYAYREEPVDVALLLLPVPPHAGHGLVVISRVPVGVKHDESVGPDQVQPTASSLTAQHEDEVWTLNIEGMEICIILVSYPRLIESTMLILVFFLIT